LTIGIQNSYILQVRYEPHISDKSRFQSQKYGMSNASGYIAFLTNCRNKYFPDNKQTSQFA